MAYVSKETKAELVAAVKKVLPKDWKVTFKIEHYSTIICTIRKAPVDLMKDCGVDDDHYIVNEYKIKQHIDNVEVRDVLLKINAALNGQNYDNSDVMTDYFDVGYYTKIQFGDWEKPFESTK